MYVEFSSHVNNLAPALPRLGKYMLMPGAVALTHVGNPAWTVDSIANTIPGKSWIQQALLVIDSTLPVFNPSAGDVQLPSFSIFNTLTRTLNGKEQRIAISGDADFASNKLSVHNGGFLMSLSSWLTNNQFPIYAPVQRPKDVLMAIGERTAYYQKKIFFWVIPSILIIAGAILLIRRKRK